MPKKIIFQEDARRKLLVGIDKIANAVATTLGPKGRNAAIDQKYGAPIVTHDGVTVAKAIDLEEPFENMGAQLLKEAAIKTSNVAGDGTTTATVLAQAIVKEGLKIVAAGANPMLIKNGIMLASQYVTDYILKHAIPIANKDDVAHVASISGQDPQIGNLIAEVIDKVGKDGVIQIEESRGFGLEIEYVEGMQFEQGYISPYFVTDKNLMACAIVEPLILLCDKKIRDLQEILPIMEKLAKADQRDLVIIAENVEGKALATLVLNKLRNNLRILAVKAPGIGNIRRDILMDIAVLTGGSIISDETGLGLDNVDIKDLGRASKILSTKETTVIIDGYGEEQAIQARIDEIRSEMDISSNKSLSEKIQQRIASLQGGVAIIHVGASTETELQEKKYRMENALNATRAAISEGIVPGGGVALANSLNALKSIKLEDQDANFGVEIMRKALEVPMCKIVENAGEDAAVVKERIRRLQNSRKNKNIGFNVMTNEYVDMIESGIPDPAKVTRTIVENASSIAAMILTTETLITEVSEENNDDSINNQ
jgi:chaperonin GroEL